MRILKVCLFSVVLLLPAAGFAAPIPLTVNQVIVDNAPFFSIGGSDGLGSFNYALNHPGFIDIPYAIFNFGAITSVSNAMLTWNFGSLYGGSGPAAITLYAGNDADGIITTGDRFMGGAVNTTTYSGGELMTFDVTAFVNASLGMGQYFAARLEVVAPPNTLSGYHGGQFLTPSLDATAGPAPSVPEPASLALIGLGLTGLGVLRVRSRGTRE